MERAHELKDRFSIGLAATQVETSSHLIAGMIFRFAAGRPSRIALVKSRAQAMNCPAAGPSVRFFSVTTLTGHGRTGKSTGNILSDLK
jgi:hypothetical protein